MNAPRLWHWRYTLRMRGLVGSRAASAAREGSLIRDSGGGVGCLHPWPELGDAPVDAQIAALAAGRPTALGRQALLCAEADGLARREGRSLFAGLRVPPSHWTAGPDFAPPPPGFGAIKLKSAAQLPRYREACPDHRLRLDFNEGFRPEAFRAFWLGLDEETRAAIEFVEDPVPWEAAAWRDLRTGLGVPLAADREVMARAAEADWLVIKPAVINAVEPAELAWRTGKRVVFTSYLDHPIGQLYAALRGAEGAAILGDRLGDCGLVTHPLFEPDAFTERLAVDGSRLVPPPGTGLGCDDLLEDLPWKPLT